MILHLFASVLIAFSVSSNVIKFNSNQNFDNFNSNDQYDNVSFSSNVEGLKPRLAPSTFIGCYNFNDTFEFSSALDELSSDYGFADEPVIFDSGLNFRCPCYMDDLDSQQFIYSMSFYHSDETSYYIGVRFRTYIPNIGGTYTYTNYDFYIDVFDGDYLVDYTQDYKSFFFYCPDVLVLSDDFTILFNTLFKNSPNAFHKVLNGSYYLTTSSTFSPSVVLSNLTFNLKFYDTLRLDDDTVSLFYWDVFENNERANVYTYPFNDSSLTNTLFYFTNSWCTMTTYNRLNSYGLFGYDPVYQGNVFDFKDMIFTVMDSQIYFYKSLLNFELFGTNLFIAFAGLLSVALILMLIRKFAFGRLFGG